MLVDSHNSLLGSMDQYPFKKHRKVIYLNSTGICNLKCPYCFTNQNKRPMSLTNADMDFLFDSLGDNCLLCFSGQGDFFAGYKKKERFLENILQRDVSIYLDFNGAAINEMLEVDRALLKKILRFDVSYHYETMHDQGVLERWAENVRDMAEVIEEERYGVKGIISMGNLERLQEKIEFYADNVFPVTGKPMHLRLDALDNNVYAPPVVKFINATIARYPEAVVQDTFKPKDPACKTDQQQFRSARGVERFCPAGSLFFKVKLDGEVIPCNKQGDITLGNLKEKRLRFSTRLIPCAGRCGPGCLANWDDKYPQGR